MHEEAGVRGSQGLYRGEALAADVFSTDHPFERQQQVGVRDDHARAHAHLLARPLRPRLDLDAARSLPLDHDAPDGRTHQDVAAVLLEALRQLVGESLRAAARVVVAEEVREPQHRVEDERCAPRRPAPVAAVACEHEFQLRVAEVVVERIAHGHPAERFEPVRRAPAEVFQKPVHVDLAHDREEVVERAGFGGELRL